MMLKNYRDVTLTNRRCKSDENIFNLVYKRRVYMKANGKAKSQYAAMQKRKLHELSKTQPQMFWK